MKTISIGKQDFASLREHNCFYIDKTDFIKEWWNSQDDVTLITRPRRFGKTLNMSMVECWMFLFSEICETFGFIRRIEYRKECWFTEITRNLSCSLPKFCSSQNKYLWERKKTDLFVDCFIIWWKYVSVKWWHIK